MGGLIYCTPVNKLCKRSSELSLLIFCDLCFFFSREQKQIMGWYKPVLVTQWRCRLEVMLSDRLGAYTCSPAAVTENILLWFRTQSDCLPSQDKCSTQSNRIELVKARDIKPFSTAPKLSYRPEAFRKVVQPYNTIIYFSRTLVSSLCHKCNAKQTPYENCLQYRVELNWLYQRQSSFNLKPLTCIHTVQRWASCTFTFLIWLNSDFY